MKSFFSLFICFCFVQMSFSAPTQYITDSRIAEIQSNLLEINGLSSKCIDEMMEVFKQFRKETTEKQKIGAALDLMSLALQAPACNNAKIDLKHVIESIDNDGVTHDQIVNAQNQLCELVPARRVQQAVIILHAFRVGATSEEHEDAILDYVSTTIQSLKTLCSPNGIVTEV